jgi:hypothetical protein
VHSTGANTLLLQILYATIERGGKEEMIAGSGKGPMNTVGGKSATIAGGGKWCNECMRWL